MKRVVEQRLDETFPFKALPFTHTILLVPSHHPHRVHFILCQSSLLIPNLTTWLIRPPCLRSDPSLQCPVQ